jgi:lipoprotein-releasing system ATP-binding protein
MTGPEPRTAAEPPGDLLRAQSVCKAYTSGDGRRLEVLRDLDLSVAGGEMVAVVGASGVGKSTLLAVLGGLDRPQAGSVLLAGENLHQLAPAALAALRNRQVGFVFQFHHLLPEFDAAENVMMPLLIGRQDPRRARCRAEELLGELGLSDRLSHRPSELSGGEQQRVAIARALAGGPSLILADEPTGNLDPVTGEAVFNMFRALQSAHRFAAVLATHNERLARGCDRIMQLDEGRLSAVSWEDVRWDNRRPTSGSIG